VTLAASCNKSRHGRVVSSRFLLPTSATNVEVANNAEFHLGFVDAPSSPITSSRDWPSSTRHEARMSSKPTIWLTGLSRSGKTTIAQGIAEWLSERNLPFQVLDGRLVRDELGNFFGYSREERIKVSRVLCVMAKLLAQNGIYPIVTAITPHAESREFNRRELVPYIEIYVESTVETCMNRDQEGLYQRAARGDIRHFIGVDVPYDVPKTHDLKINTEHDTPKESIIQAISFLSASFGFKPSESI
jgi:adenylylsulfate kinase